MFPVGEVKGGVSGELSDQEGEQSRKLRSSADWKQKEKVGGIFWKSFVCC